MEILKIPKDFDFMMFVNCMLLFMIAFFIMSFNNGESTIKYIDNNPFPTEINFKIINSSLPDMNLNYEDKLGSIMKFQSDIIKQDFRLPYFELFIYWILLPLFNISYGVYCWKTGKLRYTKKYKSLKRDKDL